jgi:hypothetical protein
VSEDFIYTIKVSSHTEQPLAKTKILQYYYSVEGFLTTLKEFLEGILLTKPINQFLRGFSIEVLECEAKLTHNPQEYIICDLTMKIQSSAKLYDKEPSASIISDIQGVIEKYFRQYEITNPLHIRDLWWDCSFWQINRADAETSEGASSSSFTATLTSTPFLLFLVIGTVTIGLFVYACKEVDEERKRNAYVIA